MKAVEHAQVRWSFIEKYMVTVFIDGLGVDILESSRENTTQRAEVNQVCTSLSLISTKV